MRWSEVRDLVFLLRTLQTELRLDLQTIVQRVPKVWLGMWRLWTSPSMEERKSAAATAEESEVSDHCCRRTFTCYSSFWDAGGIFLVSILLQRNYAGAIWGVRDVVLEAYSASSMPRTFPFSSCYYHYWLTQPCNESFRVFWGTVSSTNATRIAR